MSDKGEEVFWTVTIGPVHSLCFCDVSQDGFPDLVVATEDSIVVYDKHQSQVSSLAGTLIDQESYVRMNAK